MLTSRDLIADPIGCYPHATVACFDPTCGELPRRALDGDRLQSYLERLAVPGVDGLLIASSTGQGHLRTAEELRAWLRCAAGARLGDCLPIALLRPEDGPAVVLQMLDLLIECNYPIVFLRPGAGLGADAGDDAVYAQLAPLVEAAACRGLAIGLYSISDVSGIPLSAAVVARLVAGAGGEHIVAVKVTERDYDASTAQFLAEPSLRRLKIVQGWDPHLLRALQDGPSSDAAGRPRTGITSGLMSLALYQYLHLLQACVEQDWAEATQAQRASSALFRAMQDDGGHFADLQRGKFVMGLGHPLTARVAPEQAEQLLRAVEELPRDADRQRIARSLDLMGDGPFHARLSRLAR